MVIHMASGYKTTQPPSSSVFERIIHAVVAFFRRYSNQRSYRPEEYYHCEAYDRYRADKMIKEYMDAVKRQTYGRRFF
jgi:hypothetical protein